VSVSGLSRKMLSHPLQLKSENHFDWLQDFITDQFLISFSSELADVPQLCINILKILGKKLKLKLKCTVKKFNFITCFFGPSQMCQGEDAAAFRLDYF
jgi:hypothetical protein